MTARPNFMVTQAITADPVYEFASEVRAGLTRPGQRELPSKYLYDDVGSALFEVLWIRSSESVAPGFVVSNV